MGFPHRSIKTGHGPRHSCTSSPTNRQAHGGQKQETFKGEEQFVQKLWEIRKSPEQSQEAGLYPIAKDVLDFLEKASDLYRQSKTKNDPDPDGIDHSLM